MRRLQRHSQRRLYIPRRGGRYCRIYANRPFAKQALIKWKWTYSNDITCINQLVQILAWDNLTSPYFQSTFDNTDAIVVNAGSSNVANQSTTAINAIMKYFRRYVQYGLKIKMTLQPITNQGVIEASDAMLFTWPLNGVDGISYTAPHIAWAEVPEVRTKRFRGINMTGASMGAYKTSISRYYTLNNEFPTWRAQRDAYMGVTNASGVMTNATSLYWGCYGGIGMYSLNGTLFSNAAANWRISLVVTNYIEAWDRREITTN